MYLQGIKHPILLRSRTDNRTEIKRPAGRLQKRGNYDAVRPYGMDATRSLTYFCSAYFPVYFVVIKITRAETGNDVLLHTAETGAD